MSVTSVAGQVAAGRRPIVFGMKNAEGVFPSLPARNERGESWREGKVTINGLLSPALSSFFEEEREKGSGAALQANYLPNSIGRRPALYFGLAASYSSVFIRVHPWFN